MIATPLFIRDPKRLARLRSEYFSKTCYVPTGDLFKLKMTEFQIELIGAHLSFMDEDSYNRAKRTLVELEANRRYYSEAANGCINA